MRRRDVLRTGAAAAGGLAVGRLPGARADDIAPAPVVSRGSTRVIVLGSLGGQQITGLAGANVRCGTSVLIDVAGEVTVLDCGCGSVHRVAEAGYDLSAVRRVLITHCHFDHVSDLGSMVYSAWTAERTAGRRCDVFGPTGIDDHRRHFARSVRLSIADQEGPLAQLPRYATFARWHEFAPPRRAKTVYETDRVAVTAIRVAHGDVPAVGYRVRTPDVDIAFTGDRGAHGDHFAAFAKGADVLFSEIIHRDLVVGRLKAQGAGAAFVRHLVENHTAPQAVGRLATEAGVATLVLYHLIPGNPLVTDQAWTDLVAPHYAGRIVVAKDLMVV